MTLHVADKRKFVIDDDEDRIYIKEGNKLLTYKYHYDHKSFMALSKTDIKTTRDMLLFNIVISKLIKNNIDLVGARLTLIYTETILYLGSVSKDVLQEAVEGLEL